MVTYKFSFFFNLVEKSSFTVKKISKCRENGIDRLRNGNLQRRLHGPQLYDHRGQPIIILETMLLPKVRATVFEGYRDKSITAVTTRLRLKTEEN